MTVALFAKRRRVKILEGMRNDPFERDGSEVRDLLEAWDFVVGSLSDHHWYVVHKKKGNWDLDMFVPSAKPVSSSVVVQAVELVDELISRSPPPDKDRTKHGG